MEKYPTLQEQEGDWQSQKTVQISGLQFPIYFAPNPAAFHNFINTFTTRKEDVMVARAGGGGGGGTAIYGLYRYVPL